MKPRDQRSRGLRGRLIKKKVKISREQELNVARKFLCLAALGNIDLTCNYWKGDMR